METKTHQKKALHRFTSAMAAADVLKSWYTLGFKTKSGVYAMLCNYDPAYANPEQETEFENLWNLKRYNTQMVSDLQKALDNINSK